MSDSVMAKAAPMEKQDACKAVLRDAAKRVFLVKGYDATTVVDILNAVEGAPLSPSLFYYYYESKEKIYDEVLQDVADEYLLRFESAVAEDMLPERAVEQLSTVYAAIVRLLVVCHRMAVDESVHHGAPFGLDISKYALRRNEQAMDKLLLSLPWSDSVKDVQVSAKLIVGGILEVADGLIRGEYAQRGNAEGIFALCMRIAEQTLKMMGAPNEVRSAVLAQLRDECEKQRQEGIRLIAENDRQIFTADEVNAFVRNLSFVVDSVRIVDPERCDVLLIDVDGTVKNGGRCFGSWGICKRCKNCTGKTALKNNSRCEKYELRDDDVCHITTIPIVLLEIEGSRVPCVVEAINITNKTEWLYEVEQCRPFMLAISEGQGIYTDSLTEAFNRKYWDDRAFVDVLRTKGVTRLSLLMADLRFFKQVNDTYGHQTGDFVLHAVANKISSSIRSDDIVIRFGGDEFLILLPGCPEEVAQRVCRDIVGRVGEVYYDSSVNQGTQIDIGLAFTDNFTGEEEQIEALLHDADVSMYDTKAKNRNLPR